MTTPHCTIEQAREIISQPTIFSSIYPILWTFIDEIDESWLSDLTTSDVTRSALSRPYTPHARVYLLDHFQITPYFYAYPIDNGSRLLLLNTQTTLSLATWMGAIALVDKLRCTTTAKDVLALKQILPSIYPEVFKYAAYFAKWRRPLAQTAATILHTDWEQRCLRIGLRILATLLASLPQPIIMRQKLRFNKALADDFEPLQESLWQASDLSFPLLILKLRFPEASELCS